MNSKQRLAGETGTITDYVKLYDHALTTGSVPTYLFSAEACELEESRGYMKELKIIECEAGAFRQYGLTEAGKDSYVNCKRG
jgi:hypothetical protein